MKYALQLLDATNEALRNLVDRYIQPSTRPLICLRSLTHISSAHWIPKHLLPDHHPCTRPLLHLFCVHEGLQGSPDRCGRVGPQNRLLPGDLSAHAVTPAIALAVLQFVAGENGHGRSEDHFSATGGDLSSTSAFL